MKKLLLIIAALFISFNTFGQIEITTTIIDGLEYEIYEITGITTVTSVIGPKGDSRPEEITIPQKIYYNNKYYTVTAIKESAFGDYLIKVTCESETPQTVNINSFGTNSELKIYVPEGYVKVYKENDSWKNGYNRYANNIQPDPIVFSSNGNWSNPNNWTGLPEGGLSALTDKEVIIKANATILETDTIKVKSFKIEGNGSITIEDGGQLIVHEKSEGSVTMKKKINKYNIDNNNIITQGWYSISTPFTEITAHNLKPKDSKHEFFYYDEPSNFWRNYKATDTGFDITLGKGYIYAQEEKDTYTISITGTPNIDNTVIDLTAQSEDVNLKGFNLIGNPFMHNIKIGNIEDNNIISGAYYKLSNAGAFNVKYNDGDEIKPLEGILVQAIKDDGSIKICHEHKSSSKRSDKGSICVNVSNKEYSDVAYISFNEGIGLNKIEHRNNEIPMVYVPVDGTNYALAIMDEDVEEIPVNFEAKKMGEYTISVSAEGRKYNRLTLLDKENNKEINMLAGSYTFLATVNDNPARFILKASLNNNQEAAFYTENNSIIIDNMKGAATVHVYDVMGRPVMKYNTNDSNCQLSTSSLANGVYIIQLMDENGTQVQKVIVNN